MQAMTKEGIWYDTNHIAKYCVGTDKGKPCLEPLMMRQSRYEQFGNYCLECSATAGKEAHRRKWEGRGAWRKSFLPDMVQY